MKYLTVGLAIVASLVFFSADVRAFAFTMCNTTDNVTWTCYDFYDNSTSTNSTCDYSGILSAIYNNTTNINSKLNNTDMAINWTQKYVDASLDEQRCLIEKDGMQNDSVQQSLRITQLVSDGYSCEQNYNTCNNSITDASSKILSLNNDVTNANNAGWLKGVVGFVGGVAILWYFKVRKPDMSALGKGGTVRTTGEIPVYNPEAIDKDIRQDNKFETMRNELEELKKAVQGKKK